MALACVIRFAPGLGKPLEVPRVHVAGIGAEAAMLFGGEVRMSIAQVKHALGGLWKAAARWREEASPVDARDALVSDVVQAMLQVRAEPFDVGGERAASLLFAPRVHLAVAAASRGAAFLYSAAPRKRRQVQSPTTTAGASCGTRSQSSMAAGSVR